MLVTASGRYASKMLERHIAGAARELEAAGIGPGDAVVVCLPNDVRWAALVLALARLGAVSVPLNVASAVEEIAYVLEDSGARLALLPGGAAHSLTPRYPDRLLWPDGIATGGRVVGGDGMIRRSGITTIAYTSGTTGRPKGVLQSDRAVHLGGTSMARRLGWESDDVVVTALPLAHSYGTNVLNAALSVDATLVILPGFDETRLITAARRWGATVLAGVPTMYRRLLVDPLVRSISGVRCAVSAGQSAGPELGPRWEREVGGAFVEGWGMTELGGFAALAAPDLANRHGTVGTAAPQATLRVDPDGQGGDSRIGELFVTGPMVTPGYVGATADCVSADGWLRTGDLGTIGADGVVRVVGRAKDVILTGGFSVYPAEVERVVAQHPDVREVAVAAVADSARGEITCAWIVLRPGARPTTAQIVDFCRPHLATYKLPRQVVVLPELPLSSTGKVLRRELPVPA